MRLVAARATEDAAAPVLSPPAPSPLDLVHVDPSCLRPGVVPLRFAGRAPKCFFAMTKAFLGVLLRNRPAEPEIVHAELTDNPAFAGACGFTLPVARDRRLAPEYATSHVPSLRKLEQFDQIMTARGLWGCVALHAVAMSDAATHDSRSVLPHLARLFERLPELRGRVTVLLDDGAADDPGLKDRVRSLYGIELVTSQHPRGRRALTQDLPRGIERITPTGTPVCDEGVPFDFIGTRHSAGHFLFAAPLDEEGAAICAGCPLEAQCLRPGAVRRHVSIAFDRLPWIDPALPQLSLAYDRLMAQRTVIERVHNLMKLVYGEPRLRKRGTPAA